MQAARPKGPQGQALGPEALAACPSLDAALASLDVAYPFASHPYLGWMQAEGTERAAFLASQAPFRHAVAGFGQALAACLARVPALGDRLALAANVAEEHGLGPEGQAHAHSFDGFLRALGATPEQREGPWSAPVLAFHEGLLAFCLVQPPEASAAALGAIERAYVPVSAAIARTVAARGWAAPGSQRHYLVHEVLDQTHARDLLALPEALWAEARARQAAARGLVFGSHLFWRLYLELPLEATA